MRKRTQDLLAGRRGLIEWIVSTFVRFQVKSQKLKKIQTKTKNIV